MTLFYQRTRVVECLQQIGLYSFFYARLARYRSPQQRLFHSLLARLLKRKVAAFLAALLSIFRHAGGISQVTLYSLLRLLEALAHSGLVAD